VEVVILIALKIMVKSWRMPTPQMIAGIDGSKRLTILALLKAKNYIFSFRFYEAVIFLCRKKRLQNLLA
jgi:hypothetical protein